MDDKKRNDKEEKRGIFLGIIGVLTLIVAIIGASFAYFSVNTQSKENAVTVNAASVQIAYEDGQELVLNDLIPSTKTVALETQRRALAGETYGEGIAYQECKDDNGYTVCGVYDFTLTNNGENAVDVNMSVVPTALEETEVGFSNLKFVLYDISDVNDETPAAQKNGTEIYTGSVGYDTFGLLSTDLEAVRNIPGKGTFKKYRMFIWLNETDEAQDDEQGATFKGTVHIDLAGAGNGHVTGTAEGV